jgi:hypothetical protein
MNDFFFRQAYPETVPVFTAGLYEVFRDQGEYIVRGPDCHGEERVLSTHAKKSDACMAATLNHEQGPFDPRTVRFA